MEHKIEESEAQSLMSLNEHCMLEILEFLTLDDCINLAESCSDLRLVVNSKFKKYSTYQLDSKNINKGQMYIDKLFYYIGEYVSSLKCYCFDIHVDFTQILGKISNNCNNLKTLSIYGFERGVSESVSTVYSFDNVEVLTLSNCNSDFTKCLLKDFRKLQSVNICGFIKPDDLKMVLQNNPNIKTLIVMGSKLQMGGMIVSNGQLLELIPNVERLCSSLLIPLKINIPMLNSLPKFNRLTKLQLYCQRHNINDLLRELARTEILEEMQLECVAVDNEFFDTLMPLKKLHLMVIVPSAPAKLESSIAWPKNLKQLRLTNFTLTHNDLIAMIQQLKNIESIDIWGCDILLGNITYFNDVMTLSLKIRHVIDHSSRKQRLDVVFPISVAPKGVDLSKKYLIDSEQLRILRFTEPHVLHLYEWNPLGININFPGCVIGTSELW